jgi:hypothetical protein
MASRLNPTNFGYQNFYSALLTADITSGSLTISLDTVPTPTSGILVIDPDSSTSREVILYTSKGASTITLPSDGRGYSGSTAAAHLTGTTVIMAPIDKWFTALASGELSTDPLRTELFYDYVASGLVWTADAAGSTRNASMTSGVVYINGRRLTLAAVSARAFTASKDTYIDVSDNGDGTGLITYNEVTNNAASPALSTNNIRIGIIVTGATNIAAAGSVNQGEPTKVLPIASSVPYTVSDSLGNLICPRDPSRKLLSQRQILTDFNTASAAQVQVTGLSVTAIIPANRSYEVVMYNRAVLNTGIGFDDIYIYDGTVAGTQIQGSSNHANAANDTRPCYMSIILPPLSTATTKTYTVGMSVTAGTGSMTAAVNYPCYLAIKLL